MIMKMPTIFMAGGRFVDLEDLILSGSQIGAYIDSDHDSSSHSIYDDYDTDDGGEVTDFSEYLWMENEEEFDEMEYKRLEEEALMEQCVEAMQQDAEFEAEFDADVLSISDVLKDSPDYSDLLALLNLSNEIDQLVVTSTLNPLAEEFVPAVQFVTAAST